MMKRVLFVLFVFSTLLLNAQDDSVLYVQGFSFKQGIYLNYQQFITNSPVPKSAIVFADDSSRLDFLKQVVTKNSIQYKDTSGVVQTVKTSSIWGYSENKTVYIQWNYYFNRVTVIGTICHFASTVTNYMYTGPGTYPNQQYGTPVESMQQYVIDTKTGTVYDFNPATMEFILQRDEQLAAEYSALKKKHKKDQAFVYLRKYNERHPLYFRK